MPKVDGQFLPPPSRGAVTPPLYHCPMCLDVGWIMVLTQDDHAPPTAKPCRHCRHIIERRRKEGHYLLDHTCDECWAIRSGRVTSLDYDAEGNYIGTLPDATP